MRPVHPINMSRLQSALWPKPMLSSVWASYGVLWSLQVAKVKSFLNIKSETAPTISSTSPDFIALQRSTENKDKKVSDTTSPTDISTSTKTKTPNLGTSQPSAKSGSEDGSKLLRGLPSIPQPSTEMASALTAFKRTLLKTWRPASVPAPRGTFMVSGLVQVSGPKGHCVLDIRAAYHPAEKRWVAIGMGVRRVQLRKQAPRGGG